MTFKELRERAGVTQEYIALQLDVEQASVSRWENGTTFPSTAKLSPLAKILNCTIDELLEKDK